MRRLFRYREGINLTQEALKSGSKTTREIAFHIIKAKGLEERDSVLRKVICRHIVHQLRRQAQQGKLPIVGRKKAGLI